MQVSNYRPHQYKHIYYARLDGQTRPAPHYLVEALMKQITYPNAEILHFGRPVLRSERIIILFGGKYSPVKSSKYVIDLNQGATLTNYNTLIAEKEENMTMAEGQQKLGKKREDFPKTYLGR